MGSGQPGVPYRGQVGLPGRITPGGSFRVGGPCPFAAGSAWLPTGPVAHHAPGLEPARAMGYVRRLNLRDPGWRVIAGSVEGRDAAGPGRHPRESTHGGEPRCHLLGQPTQRPRRPSYPITRRAWRSCAEIQAPARGDWCSGPGEAELRPAVPTLDSRMIRETLASAPPSPGVVRAGLRRGFRRLPTDPVAIPCSTRRPSRRPRVRGEDHAGCGHGHPAPARGPRPGRPCADRWVRRPARSRPPPSSSGATPGAPPPSPRAPYPRARRR